MLKERNTNGSEGGYSPQASRDAELRQVLVEHGIASEHINEVLEQLNVLADMSLMLRRRRQASALRMAHYRQARRCPRTPTSS